MTCWKKDEYVMDMWVRAPICDVPPPRPSIRECQSVGCANAADRSGSTGCARVHW